MNEHNDLLRACPRVTTAGTIMRIVAGWLFVIAVATLYAIAFISAN